jgi:hypothetical protein
MVGLLAGCAGTIKQDKHVKGDISRVEGVSQVFAVLSPEATKLQSDNPQFSREELASFLRRKLEAKSLVAPAATHRIEVMVTDIRVRSGVAAIMLGILAGEDRVAGNVRVLDANGRALRSFEVKATYAFGGIAGGQDGMRMNWLYDKFSEMASEELEKVIGRPTAGVVSASAPAVAPLSPAQPTAAPIAPMAPMAPTGSPVATEVALADVDAVPVGPRCKEGYREFLTWKLPRAYVVADGQRCSWAQSFTPKDPTKPRDPAERAMQNCRDEGKTNCTLYAVNDRVVYIKPSTTASR